MKIIFLFVAISVASEYYRGNNNRGGNKRGGNNGGNYRGGGNNSRGNYYKYSRGNYGNNRSGWNTDQTAGDRWNRNYYQNEEGLSTGSRNHLSGWNNQETYHEKNYANTNQFDLNEKQLNDFEPKILNEKLLNKAPWSSNSFSTQASTPNSLVNFEQDLLNKQSNILNQKRPSQDPSVLLLDAQENILENEKTYATASGIEIPASLIPPNEEIFPKKENSLVLSTNAGNFMKTLELDDKIPIVLSIGDFLKAFKLKTEVTMDTESLSKGGMLVVLEKQDKEYFWTKCLWNTKKMIYSYQSSDQEDKALVLFRDEIAKTIYMKTDLFDHNFQDDYWKYRIIALLSKKAPKWSEVFRCIVEGSYKYPRIRSFIKSLMEKFIKCGDVDVQHHGVSPMDIIAKFDFSSLVRPLVEKGANVNGTEKLVKMPLDCGAKVDMNFNSMTPLDQKNIGKLADNAEKRKNERTNLNMSDALFTGISLEKNENTLDDGDVEFSWKLPDLKETPLMYSGSEFCPSGKYGAASKFSGNSANLSPEKCTLQEMQKTYVEYFVNKSKYEKMLEEAESKHQRNIIEYCQKFLERSKRQFLEFIEKNSEVYEQCNEFTQNYQKQNYYM